MKRAITALLLGFLAVLALVLLLNFRGEDKIHDAPPLTPPAGETVARGAYLMRAGIATGAWGSKAVAVGKFTVGRQRGSAGP